MNTVPARQNGSDSEYRRNVRALELAAAQLERGDLDPEQALEVYREALRRYEAAMAILNTVAEEFSRIEMTKEDENNTG
jgi:exonuclease VII small subunit